MYACIYINIFDTNVYKYIYIYIYIHTYMYIYIEREYTAQID